MSSKAVSISSGGQVQTSNSSSKKMMSSSSTSSQSSFSSSSSTTVKSSSSMKTTSIKSSSSSSSVNIRSGGSSFKDTFNKQHGLDIDSKMAELTAKMDAEFERVKKEFFHLSIMDKADPSKDLIKLDKKSIMDLIDDSDKDKVKLNLDVDEFESETISVKAVGNQVEVHAKKKSRKGDQEQSEEFSRTFEMPTGKPIDPEKITSSFYKDGVLTVELPVNEAISAS